ncbi:MAG TPA: hypothetical protein VGC82_17610, partial [Rhodopila sp.]
RHGVGIGKKMFSGSEGHGTISNAALHVRLRQAEINGAGSRRNPEDRPMRRDPAAMGAPERMI